MDALHLGLLLSGSVAAGVVNALAGGGSLVTLPILLGLGLPPVSANATNAVAAWAGLIGGSLRYAPTLAPHRRTVGWFAVISTLGGAIGGALMLATPRAVLHAAMPWLVLVATLTFLLAPYIHQAVRGKAAWDLDRTGDLAGWRGVVHFLVSIATGYFNPAGGVMMVAAFHGYGLTDLRLANGLKIVLGMTMTGASVAVFVLAGAVIWPIALLMVAGTILGGWLGAGLALRVDRRWLRGFVLAWGGMMSVAFLVPA
ncbi:sulfite exporter TauE/SafE family protein [Pinisolibacter aquiterrae]|uniref:sulfite exporter TauE/SafE family protein n=1 Tax=Pinisolibacter aquiterrae TaxID=2815579 RepID=UPI001C3CCF38|nr:sulfite exporter TauE/SafE family protein [Pinisolibacter aquiterrae]MBV5264466.1 sulfite exporter TauE/SafE family protein [Pinisolibacter aquiterrae]MCC8234385.1 sulfite exporter TauE/SafE family protein [Pinisolibacter aquiterrae]